SHTAHRYLHSFPTRRSSDLGITPEAPTLDDAFAGRAPEATTELTTRALRAARDELTTAGGEPLDMIVLGSPHFSVAEFKRLAPRSEEHTSELQSRSDLVCRL